MANFRLQKSWNQQVVDLTLWSSLKLPTSFNFNFLAKSYHCEGRRVRKDWKEGGVKAAAADSGFPRTSSLLHFNFSPFASAFTKALTTTTMSHPFNIIILPALLVQIPTPFFPSLLLRNVPIYRFRYKLWGKCYATDLKSMDKNRWHCLAQWEVYVKIVPSTKKAYGDYRILKVFLSTSTQVLAWIHYYWSVAYIYKVNTTLVKVDPRK